MVKAVAESIAAGSDRETNSRDAGLVAVGRNSFVKMTPRMGAADAQWRLRAGMNAVLREARLRAVGVCLFDLDQPGTRARN